MHTNIWEYPDLFFIDCPIEDSRYRSRYQMIDGICVFYEKSRLKYEAAKSNCESKFNGNGRLYEPRSLATLKKVRKTGLDNYFGLCPYIGINDISEEGTWVYTSDGSPVSMSIPWASYWQSYWDSKPDFKATEYNCAVFTNSYPRYELVDYPCTSDSPSICELDL